MNKLGSWISLHFDCQQILLMAKITAKCWSW